MFAGPSGTGKTMAAQVLARSLDMKLYRVDLAGVMNKYIGETEKRLKRVFDACERATGYLTTSIFFVPTNPPFRGPSERWAASL